MIGAIIGDIIGSRFEWRNTKSEDFVLFTRDSCFTDDSVMTIATGYAITTGTSYREAYQKFYHRYPNAGYGARFAEWADQKQSRAYQSYGNGSAMRVSPVAFARDSEAEVLAQAKKSAEVSHNHLEGIKGAQAIALSIYYARQKKSKSYIKTKIEQRFGYDLQESIATIRKSYGFDVSCQGSVPQAIISFLESSDFETAIRKAISIGGDSDTIACMAGGIAATFYDKIPETICQSAFGYLDPFLKKQIKIFLEKYPVLTDNKTILKLL